MGRLRIKLILFLQIVTVLFSISCSNDNVKNQMYNYLCTVDNVTALKSNLDLFAKEAGKMQELKSKLYKIQAELNPRYVPAGPYEKMQTGDGSWAPVLGFQIMNNLTSEKRKELEISQRHIKSEIKWSTECDLIHNRIGGALPVSLEFKNTWDKERASWTVSETENGVYLIRGNGLGMYITAPSYGQWSYNVAQSEFKPGDEYSSKLMEYLKDIYYDCDLELKDASAYNIRGVDFCVNGGYDKAIADFTKAIELNPKDDLSYHARGFAYGEKGEYDKAIADLTKAIDLDPKFEMAYNDRGRVYSEISDYDKSIADFTKAIELNPKDGFFYHNRGIAYMYKGDSGKAHADFDKGNKLGW